MKALVTVVGRDQIGIIGGVCTELARLDVNILEISQTVMSDYFTMIMMVDLATSGKNMETLSSLLGEYGKSRGLNIKLQRTDIFDAMHNI